MPDPHKDLADIVEPQITVATASGGGWLEIGGIAIVASLVAGVLFWHWRRRAPLRALRRLRRRTDVQQAADELAALLPHFKQTPDATWLEALQRLRFGPAQEDAQLVFDTLCEQAMHSLTPTLSRGEREQNRLPLTKRQTSSPLPPGEGQG